MTSFFRLIETIGCLLIVGALGSFPWEIDKGYSTAMPYRVNHDLHLHTTWSDGARTIAEQVYFARCFRLAAIAITDHAGRGFGLDDESRLRTYREEIYQTRAGSEDILVLAGAEASALDCRGSVTLDEASANRMEWVLCDLGGCSEGTLRNAPASSLALAENVIRTYLALCAIPWIDAIAHPFNTGNLDRPLLPSDYPPTLLDELADAMADTGTVFDVMNLMPFWFLRSGIEPEELAVQYSAVVRQFAGRGVRFQVSSDDHRCGLGHTTWSHIVLHAAGVAQSQIVDPTAIPRR